MSSSINRREFLRTGLKVGLTAAVASPLLRQFASAQSPSLTSETPEIAVVWGDDYGKNAFKAMELIGGIERFVPKNSRVAILANVQSSHPGHSPARRFFGRQSAFAGRLAQRTSTWSAGRPSKTGSPQGWLRSPPRKAPA